MNRLRFRAWDMEELAMTYSKDWGEEEWHINMRLGNVEGEGLSVMQSTGYYDSDNKEIFEGDVLHSFKYKESWEVQWNEGKGCWYLRLIPGTRVSSTLPLWEVEGREIYVMGNIYEQPELLNEESDE